METIYEVNRTNGQKTSITEKSLDAYFEKLRYDSWEIYLGENFNESIPKCVNAVVVAYRTSYSRSRTVMDRDQYYFQVVYSKGKRLTKENGRA